MTGKSLKAAVFEIPCEARPRRNILCFGNIGPWLHEDCNRFDNLSVIQETKIIFRHSEPTTFFTNDFKQEVYICKALVVGQF